MESSTPSRKTPGSPEATDAPQSITPNKKQLVRLIHNPSPATTTTASPSINNYLAKEALGTETSAAETSTAAEGSQRKKRPAPKKTTKVTPKKGSLATATKPATKSTPPKQAGAPIEQSTLLKKVPAYLTESSTSPISSLAQKKASPAPATKSTPPKEADTPTQASTSHQRIQVPNETPNRLPESTRLIPQAASPSNSSIPDLSSQPNIHPENFAPIAAATMGKPDVSISPQQILCCKSGIISTSPLRHNGHHDLKTFMNVFAGKTAQAVTAPKTPYSAVWTEYTHLIGVMYYDSNTVAWDSKIYGCEKLNKGPVVELLPEQGGGVRPAIVTKWDAERMNEECLVRVDGGVDFQCKTHGYWRYTAYFLKWQAPGEKDKREKAEEKLARKMKKRGPLAGGQFGFGGLSQMQSENGDKEIGSIGMGTGGGGGTGGGSQMDSGGGDIQEAGFFNAEFEATTSGRSRHDA
jgi:hypothetical protein